MIAWIKEQTGIDLMPHNNADTEDNEGRRVLIDRNTLEPLLVLITLLALLGSVAASALDAPEALVLALNLTSYLAGGWYATQEGLRTLLSEGDIDVDLLMVVAALGAAFVGHWTEGATLLFLFSLSNVLQAYAIGRSRNAIKSLLKLRPDTANVRRNGHTEEVSIDDLQVGDVVVIRPGERLPADGEVVSGSSAIDQSNITGESMPVQKDKGDQVFASTVNGNGTLDVRVTKLATESTVSRIISMVEEAQERHSTTQRRLDRFEQVYARWVIIGVALMIALPPLLFDVSFSDNFYQAMVLLVVASPCALVISTPASILSAIANAARNGVLFKGGAHLEDMRNIKVFAFDKTGTITIGEPRVTDVIPYNGDSERELLGKIACAESTSEHPIAQAIVQHAQDKGIDMCEPEEFEAQPGRGVIATLKGQQIIAGNDRLMREHQLEVPQELATLQHDLENEGKTALYVYADEWLGLVAVADKIREGAVDAIRRLREAGAEQVVMLTGDNERVASYIAQEAGLTEFYADLLPDQKVKKVEELEKEYGQVAMVGDGVNDAPALATAHLGIAMGAAGTDVALETADVVLMANDLSKIPYAYTLSRRARRVVTQNLSFSVGVIVVLVALTLLPVVTVPLPLGVVGHEGSTIIVVMNGLRLLVARGG